MLVAAPEQGKHRDKPVTHTVPHMRTCSLTVLSGSYPLEAHVLHPALCLEGQVLPIGSLFGTTHTQAVLARDSNS